MAAWHARKRTMIDDAILAAITTRLSGASALPARRYRPVMMGGSDVGRVDGPRAARLAAFGCFRLTADAIALDPALAEPDARSAALAVVARTLRDEGALPAWRDEPYAIAPAFGAPPLAVIERGAARYFGLCTYAAHVNGVLEDEGATCMWLARRSLTKAVDPGLLDSLVGGGIAAGMRVDETLVKEAWEEAAIPEALARRARPAGLVHARKAVVDGLQREILFVHDLALQRDFVPRNNDGEVSEHRLVRLENIAPMLAQSAGPDAVAVDASVVALDFLLRQGAIAPDAPGYLTLQRLVRLPLD
jgi:8-oxo-dGTP pyrophosphatase MutT (NUDIX family)